MCIIEVIAEAVQIVEVAGVVLVALAHRRIEAVFGNAYAFAKYRGLEGLGREVTLHLLDVRLAEQLQVLYR